MEQATLTHNDSATQMWLMEAIGYALTQNQTKLASYLEEVSDDSVFEMELVARKAHTAEWGLPLFGSA